MVMKLLVHTNYYQRGKCSSDGYLNGSHAYSVPCIQLGYKATAANLLSVPVYVLLLLVLPRSIELTITQICVGLPYDCGDWILGRPHRPPRVY